MVSREIIPGVLWVGALDFDRRIFDELIPLPSGTSYNAYLIRGSEKTALIDTVDPTKEFDLISNLVKLGIERIDYIIVNHAEQDHAGSLPMVLEFFPDAMIVTNEKCRDLLIALLHLPADKFMVVKDRETLSLGDRTLEFILTPWTHWPETQVTYLREDRILFPCDLFGYHTATSDLYVTEQAEFYIPAKRYFAEIMMPFRGSIKGHLEKIRALKIDLIAPSHGPIHKNPQLILDAYADWVSDDVKNEVVIPYVSMHGSTQKMVEHFTNALIARGVTGQTLQPDPYGYRGTCPCARGCCYGGDRHADRALWPSPPGRLCHLSCKHAQAQDAVCIGHRIVRLGREGSRNNREDARSCQGRGP